MDHAQVSSTTSLNSGSSPFRKLTMQWTQLAQSQKLAIILFGIALILLLAAFVFKQPASDSSVADPVAMVNLEPASAAFSSGSSQTVILKANTGGRPADGFQVFIDLTGTIPTNIQFTAANLQSSGLRLVTSELATKGAGKELKLLFITSNPTSPFTASTAIELGRFTFTAPASGSLTLAFSSSMTKIIEHNTVIDLVIVPGNSVYTFGGATSSATSSTATSAAVCGNGTVNTGELCDDGNTSNYDQCSSDCKNQCTTGNIWNGTRCVQLACRGDYDRNGNVDAVDFLKFAQNYKKAGISCDLDIIGANCYLDALDFLEFAKVYKKPNLCN